LTKIDLVDCEIIGLTAIVKNTFKTKKQ